MAAPFLEVVNVHKSFVTPAEPLAVLKGVNLEIQGGEKSFIVGRSGCGKSTLLHLIGALDKPTQGQILFRGKDYLEMNEKALAKFRNEHIGFVFQAYHLLQELTLLENVLLPAMIKGKVDKSWGKHVLQRVQLWDRRNHYPNELSGGERQRAAIARALINHPEVVLCDEPTGNLDEESAQDVFKLIDDLNKEEGQAFVIVTHDENWAWQTSNVHRLHEGVIQNFGENSEEVKSKTSY